MSRRMCTSLAWLASSGYLECCFHQHNRMLLSNYTYHLLPCPLESILGLVLVCCICVRGCPGLRHSGAALSPHTS